MLNQEREEHHEMIDAELHGGNFLLRRNCGRGVKAVNGNLDRAKLPSTGKDLCHCFCVAAEMQEQQCCNCSLSLMDFPEHFIFIACLVRLASLIHSHTYLFKHMKNRLFYSSEGRMKSFLIEEF